MRFRKTPSWSMSRSTTGRGFFPPTAAAAPHDWLQNMGGSIGFSTPVATGAAVACPDRKVICMVGDGSAMYTLQSLWTQAREEPRRHHHRVRQPQVSNPARRVRRRRCRRARPARARYAQPRPSGARLGVARQGHGRVRPNRSPPRRTSSSALTDAGARKRPATDRSRDVTAIC